MEEVYFWGDNFVIMLKVTGIMSNSALTRHKLNNMTQSGELIQAYPGDIAGLLPDHHDK